MLASDVMKSQIKLLANKTWHSFKMEYLLKDKYTKSCISNVYNY